LRIRGESDGETGQQRDDDGFGSHWKSPESSTDANARRNHEKEFSV
jgi:hypothetical protein